MNHTFLTQSVKGVYKYRHTRLARFAHNPPSPISERANALHIQVAGCRGVSPYAVKLCFTWVAEVVDPYDNAFRFLILNFDLLIIYGHHGHSCVD